MAEGVVHGPGEGETLAVGPSKTVVKVTGEDTGGAFFLCETTIAPGFPGPPPHRHERLVDMFYVLEGELTMLVGGESRTLGPGSFACAPPGVLHTFSNQSDAPARFLNFNTPSGWEHYMRDLAATAAAEGGLTPQAIGRVAAGHDIQIGP